MKQNINAEIIAVGTEILLGEITDTNSVHIARQFRDIGVNVFYMTSVGDNEQRIATAIGIALQRADVVITCGGLGPTIDDVTRQGIAKATNRELVFDQTLYDQIAARFEMYKVTMTENNRRQAFLPAGAIPIPNPVGTAPCFIVEVDDKAVISLPGVPREMKFLMKETVIPYLLNKYNLGIIKARLLKTAGIGESSLDDMLGSDLLERSNPTIGLAAHHGTIDIRLTAKADTIAQAEMMLDAIEAEVRARAGRFIFGMDADELEPSLIALLEQRAIRLSVTEVGIDNAVIGKLQAYRNGEHILATAVRLDDVRQLTAAEDVDLRMLAEDTVRRSLADDVQASIVILSLPDVAENADVEVATVVAVGVGDQIRSRVYGFGGQSDLTRDWVSRWAMASVWRMVKDMTDDVA